MVGMRPRDAPGVSRGMLGKEDGNAREEGHCRDGRVGVRSYRASLERKGFRPRKYGVAI